ncbi:hypothetical protein D3C72_1363520 [compost metagenome]
MRFTSSFTPPSLTSTNLPCAAWRSYCLVPLWRSRRLTTTRLLSMFNACGMAARASNMRAEAFSGSIDFGAAYSWTWTQS